MFLPFSFYIGKYRKPSIMFTIPTVICVNHLSEYIFINLMCCLIYSLVFIFRENGQTYCGKLLLDQFPDIFCTH